MGGDPKGTLLTHTDRYWYIFDCQGDCESNQQATLVADFDDHVQDAQISEGANDSVMRHHLCVPITLSELPRPLVAASLVLRIDFPKLTTPSRRFGE